MSKKELNSILSVLGSLFHVHYSINSIRSESIRDKTFQTFTDSISNKYEINDLVNKNAIFFRIREKHEPFLLVHCCKWSQFKARIEFSECFHFILTFSNGILNEKYHFVWTS